MTQEAGVSRSFTPHYHEIRGRAAEIARAMGCPVGGAEHLFLAMLHDGGWPVSVIAEQVDLGRAEAQVLAILDGPDYSPPPPPTFPMSAGDVQLWGVRVAPQLGDSYVGVQHALLAMIRTRDTVPARALAGLADLDALEAAVLAARNAPSGRAPTDAVFLPDGQAMDRLLFEAAFRALPEETTLACNRDAAGRTWWHVIGPGATDQPGLTREVLNTALASLHRPVLDS